MRSVLMIRRVSGTSMVPLLLPGNVVVATGLYNHLRSGDIVIIKHEGLEKIKRLSNVDDRGIYVLGDNLTASTDSRHFGWLPQSAVIAKVVRVLRIEH